MITQSLVIDIAVVSRRVVVQSFVSVSAEEEEEVLVGSGTSVLLGRDIVVGGQDFVAMAVGDRDGGGHALLSAHLSVTLNALDWHGEFVPAMANKCEHRRSEYTSQRQNQ